MVRGGSAIVDAITLRKLYAGDRLPVDVDQVAERDGKHIFRFDLGPRVRELFVVDTILINSAEQDPVAIRWLKAHALGHVGHAGQPTNERALPQLQSVYVQREEKQADMFARHLLIPAEEWLEAQTSGDFDHLRQLVGVPEFALEAYARDVATGLFVPEHWGEVGAMTNGEEPEMPKGWHLIGVKVNDPLHSPYFDWRRLPSVPRQVKEQLDAALEPGSDQVTALVDDHWYRLVEGVVYMAVPK